MANTFQIKRHSSNTNSSAPGTLANGELALNQASKKLFVGRHNNSSVEVFHLPTLQDLTYGAGISGTVASGSDNNASTIAVDLTDSNIFASTSAKGIASFASADFSVSSGVVSIGSIGTSQIDADAITGAKIADDQINSEHIVADSLDAEHYAASSVDTTALANNSVTSAKIVDGTIVAGDIANDTITAAKLAHDLTLPGNITSGGNLTVTGNLTVQGDTTTLNTATLTVEDKEIVIANGAADSAGADGAGIRIDGASATLLYDDTGTQWEMNKPLEITGTLAVSSTSTFTGAITASGGFTNTTFDCGTY
jgi:hypothetical protein